MANPGRPVPPYPNISHSILHNPTFIQHNHNIDQRLYIRSGERPGYARLLGNVATAALHDSVHVVDPPKCYPNTRVAIIQNIRDWTVGKAEEQSGKPILWLKGGAGAGKSAIARSVAERCSEEGLLLGTFFFGAADSTRNHVGKLVATLSYQISLILPEFRDTVAGFIEEDPLIFDRSISTQFNTLIIRPFWRVLTNHSATLSTIPCLIIIDGLDECSAVNSQRDLLLTLQEVTNTTSLIRFLICSRPESHLNNTFSLSHMDPIIYKIFLDDDYAAGKDIRVYLEDKFKQIKEGHLFKHALPDPWPTPRMVYDLVDKSSGQFIYAATVVGYVGSPRHRPDQRLDVIFNLRPQFKDLPFTELDALYRLIISKADDLPTVLDILAFPALYSQFDAQDIETILQLEHGAVEVMLADLHSIVTIFDGCVKFLHKSLADFLSEPQRAGELYCDLLRVQLSHVARVINIFSMKAHCCDYTHIFSPDPESDSLNEIYARGRFLTGGLHLSDPDNKAGHADYVSSDILQATQQFPIVEFLRPLLLFSRTEHIPMYALDFIVYHLNYLYCIKDVRESTRLVYWEQMRRYCECVLAVLDNDLSGNWNANFTFAYYHLLGSPHYHVPRKLSIDCVDLENDLSSIDVGTFGHTIISAIRPFWCDYPFRYIDDIVKISHDIIGDTQKQAIFAKSACFCIVSLCDERRASQDAGRIYGIARHDRRRKREHPWHWRQMVPRPPSLGHRLALIGIRRTPFMEYRLKLTRIRKALRNTIPYLYDTIRVIPMREYFELKSETQSRMKWCQSKPIPKWWPRSLQHERPQQWPRYLFLLDLLPHILPLAGRYEPLVTMCRKKCLSSLSKVWPKKSRRARQAVESYLRRMGSQEGM